MFWLYPPKSQHGSAGGSGLHEASTCGHPARIDPSSENTAVAAYNAGPGNVHGRVPDIGQTRVYVEKVMKRFASKKRAS